MAPSKPPPVTPVVGDVVVTKVSQHYYVGRAQAEGDALRAMGVFDRSEDALYHASRFITGQQRVFFYAYAASRYQVQIFGPSPPQTLGTNKQSDASDVGRSPTTKPTAPRQSAKRTARPPRCATCGSESVEFDDLPNAAIQRQWLVCRVCGHRRTILADKNPKANR